MLRLIVQTKRNYKMKMKKSKEEIETKSDEEPINEKMTKKTKTVTKILKKRRKKVTAQTQIATKTVKLDCTPEAWWRIRIKVIYKQGEAH